MSTLEQLRGVTTIVADTGDFNVLKEYAPQDGTTNPSHILNAAKKPQYKTIIEEAARYGKATSPGDPKAQVEHAFLRVLVEFGCEILKCIPGRVSTEVDAIHSFNKHKTVNMAREIIALYKELGVSKERVLIKIASTWEGFQACRVLEAEGIHCNMTVLFSPVQAKLAAEVNATLISPFVGRSMDWWQKNHPGADYTGLHDPGVRLVRQIHEYYTSNGIQTEIMAASLRNIDECVHLAGIGLMTISVRLLEDLRKAEYPIVTQFWIHKGNHETGSTNNGPSSPTYLDDEASFRFDLFNDRMAFEKMSESLRIFLDDGEELKRILLEAIGSL